MAKKPSEKPKESKEETGLPRSIGKITAVVVAITALITAVVHFRDSIPWLTPIAKIELTPPPPLTMVIGEKSKLSATVRDSAGNALKKIPLWTSADPSVATVDKDGIVEGKGRGQTTINVAVGPVQNSAIVTVRKVNVAYVQIFPSAKTMIVDEHLKFDAVPYDSDKNPLPGRTIRWNSENDTVATVDASTGEATAKSTGKVNVQVQSEGQEDSATVQVNAKPAANSPAEAPTPPPPHPPSPQNPILPNRGAGGRSGRGGAAAAGAGIQVEQPAVVLAPPPAAHVALKPVSGATATITIANGIKFNSCPAQIRIMIGDTLTEIRSDPQETGRLVPGTTAYQLHGTVVCPGETQAVVNGKGSITVTNGKSVRLVWKQIRPKVFEIELKE